MTSTAPVAGTDAQASPAVAVTLFPLAIAAVAGIVHGAFSLSWAWGSNWLLPTLGNQVVSMFADARWMLLPVGLVKIGFAILPLVLARAGVLGRRLWRVLCGLGAVVLIGWGGLGALSAQLVLTGVVVPEGGYDELGMLGHAWLWDPLFLVWGVALATGVRAARTSHRRG